MKLGAALASFLESIDPKRLPLHGGDATTVIVTMSLEQLTKPSRLTASRSSRTPSPPPKPDASPTTPRSSPPS